MTIPVSSLVQERALERGNLVERKTDPKGPWYWHVVISWPHTKGSVIVLG
jgi:hypothetical protein